MSLRDMLLWSGTATLLIRALAMALSLAVSVLLARGLGPEQYGLYAAVMAVITILAMPVKLGLPTLVVRETARACAAADWPHLRGIWRWSTGFALVGAAGIGAGMLSVLWLFPHEVADPWRQTFLWAIPLILLIALANLRAAAMQGLHRIVLSQLPDKVLRPTLLALFVLGAVMLPGPGMDAARAMSLHVAAAAISLVAGAGLLWACRPAPFCTVEGAAFRHALWFRAILPLSAIAGLQVLSQNTDLIMLAALRTEAEVGLYRVALNGATLVIFGLAAIGALLQPHIVRLYAGGDTARLQWMATAAARICLLLTLPVVLAIALYGAEIITLLFGAEYRDATRPLMILAAAQMVNAFFGSAGALLSMSGHEGAALRALLVSTAVNLGLNAALIPPFGIEGAAMATGISIIAWNLLFWISVRRRLGLDSSALGRFGLGRA